MRAQIIKTKLGERAKIYDTFESVAEAKEQLKKIWKSYTMLWSEIDPSDGIRSSGKVLNCDVYRFEIINASEL